MNNTIVPSFGWGVAPQNKAEMTTSKKNANKVVTDAMVIAKARKGFNYIPSNIKSNDLKFQMLRSAALTLDDAQKFYGRYMVEARDVAEKLSDKVSVVSFCKEEGIDIFTLSTHVVFMGKTTVQKVIKFGLGEGSPIRGQVSLFKDPFLPDNAQDFVDQSWTPSKLIA